MLLVLSACGLERAAPASASDPPVVDPWSVQQPAGLHSPGDAAMVTRALAPSGSSPWLLVGAVVHRGRPVPTAWASTDSVHWTESQLPLAAGEPADGEVLAAVGLHDSVIALGTTWRGDVPRTAAWVERGDRWSAVPEAQVPNLTNARVTSMAAGAGGVIAAGTALDARGRRQPAVWASSDGSTWQARRLPLGPDVALSSVAVMGGVTVLGGTAIRASATVAQPFGDAPAAFWWSTDGSAWHEAQAPSATAGGEQTVTGITEFHGHFVAAGSGLKATGVLPWIVTSSDGRSWKEQRSLWSQLGGTSITGITTGGGKLLVAGGGGSPLAMTTDESHWTVGMGFPGQTLDDVVTSGGRDLVVAEGALGLHSAVWSRNARYPRFWDGNGPYADWSRGNLPSTSLEPSPVSIWPTSRGWYLLGTQRSGGSPPTLWHSSDLTTWSPLPSPPAGGDFLLEAGGRLLLYHGGGGRSDGPGVSTSVDGQRWDTPGSGSLPSVIAAIASGPQGLVALGIDSLYRSRDGLAWSRVGPPGMRWTGSGGICANSRAYVAVLGPQMVLSSRDGQQWAPVDPGLGSGLTGLGCAQAGDRLLLVGRNSAPSVVVSGSDDGTSWQPVSAGFDPSAAAPLTVGSSKMGAIIITGSVPRGLSSLAGPGLDVPGLAVWGSIDGRVWHRLGPPPALARAREIRVAVVGANGLAIVLGTIEAGVATVWTTPIPAP